MDQILNDSQGLTRENNFQSRHYPSISQALTYGFHTITDR